MKTGYFLAILICGIGGSQVSTRCPVRWLERPEGNSCYRFWPTRMKTWTEARKTCQARDGDLLRLNSKHEKEWIINEVKKYPVHYEWWIGLERHSGNDSIWVWTDGTARNESQNYIPWGSGEPNNHRDSEDCAEIWDNLLNDKNCDQPLQFICERPKDLPMKCDVDNGWDDVTSTYCYKYFSDKSIFNDASSTCVKEGGSLLTVTEASFQQKITDFLDHEDKATVWLKYQFDSSRSNWHSLGVSIASDDWWVNGVPDTQTVVDNDTLCSVIDTTVEGDKNWKPESCDASNSFMCEKGPGVCPYGYIQHKSKCYLLNMRQFMTWNEARGFCNLRATTLLEIKNNNDWYYILSMLKSHYGLSEIKSVWLGLSGKDENNLAWDSGEDKDDFVTSMSNGKLDTSLSDTQCAFIEKSILSDTDDKSPWKFGDCGGSRGAICTIPVNQPVQTPPLQIPRYECPEGYTLNGVICYHWNPDDPVDWYTAREKCAKEGADLVTIQSEEEQTFVFSHIQSASWIGLNDRKQEGTFSWLDTTAEIGVTYWFKKQPNNVEIGGQYSENCVAMLYLPGNGDHGKWMDYPCSYKARFLCQIPAEWNIALGKIASQSSVYQISQYQYDSYAYDYKYGTEDSDDTAEKAIDDCITKSIKSGSSSSCCARTDTEDTPWWMVDLGTSYPIGKIVIHRQSQEACQDCSSKFRDFRLFISNTSRHDSPDDSDIVYQETRSHIPAVIVLNLQNVTVGRYVIIDIPRSSEALSLCEVKIYQGESLQRSVSPTNSNCIVDSTKWTGDIRHTVSGRTCQAWILDTPQNHGYHDKTFPDGTEEEAENLCRDPLGEGQPWCYTVDPNVRWEFCPVPHCTSEVGLLTSDIEAEENTDCGTDWIEDPNSGACYWLGEEVLTWADARSVCTSIGASLTLPADSNDMNLLTGKLTSQQTGLLFWLGVYYEVDKKSWVSDLGSITSFILDKLGTSSPTTIKCVVADRAGNMYIKYCLDRNVYSCMKMGPFMKYSTSADGDFKQLPSSMTTTVTDSSRTTYNLKFEYKGIGGAALKIHQASDSQPGNEYTVRIGGKIFAKSSISKLDSTTPKYSSSVPDLSSEDEYKAFWIRWTCGNSNGDTIDVGRGTDVGRNMFMKWTDPAGIQASSVSVATDIKTSKVYKGYWRFTKENQKSKTVEAVNLALKKTARQSSLFAAVSSADKVVDGCTTNTYRSHCITHTGYDYEPWWEVDLGQVYPIREVVIYRRGPECCTERLGYFRLLISMLSDSTIEEDVVYQSVRQEPPFIMRIPTKGKHGRYVKIDIPGRKEYLELAEVEVYEDLDSSRCGNGWLDYGLEATCYKFSEVQMDWDNAKQFCDGLNSAMVIPKTAAEQLFLYERSLPITNQDLNSKSVWLGLHDRASEGSFQTSDGLTLAYTDWGKGEPNDYGSGEDCGALRIDWSDKSGKWNDQNCKATLKAVCKKKELTTTTSTTTTTTTEATTTTTTVATTTTVTEKPMILSQGGCKADWIYSPMSSSCLRIFKSQGISFYKAASECIDLGSRLSNIENSMEQDFIAEMIKREGIIGKKWDGLWSGGFDDHKEGDWRWFMDNSTWHSSVKWKPGQPDNTRGTENCAVIMTRPDVRTLLNDAVCEDALQGYVCKYILNDKMCKDGWVYNGLTDTCYRYEQHNKAKWNDARLKCDAENGILATIASKTEQLFIKALIANSKVKGVWVGAHDLQEEGIYQWIDGTTWINNLWAPDQPNNWKSNQHCAMVVVNGIANALGLLQDDFCEDKYAYICAIKSCAAGWEKFENNCYLFSLTNRGWVDAKADCESEGARLLIVDNEKEHNFIRQKVIDARVHYMWIGARYDKTHGDYRWVDGSPMAFTAWAPGRPGSMIGCVDYLDNVGFLWNSHLDCVNTRGPYICEKASVSAVGLTEPTTSTTSSATTKASATTTKASATTTTVPVITTRTTVEKVIGKCGPDWDSDPSSGLCYKFVIELASWTDAQSKCSEDDGNLVSIVSDQEQSYITGRLQGVQMLPEAMWIGASDTDFESGWKWVDEKPFAYLNWAFGEPNNYVANDAEGEVPEGEDCVALVTGERQYFGQWNDLQCSSKKGYICKKNVDTEVTTKPTRPRPDIEETGIIEIYQKPEAFTPDFKSHDLYEMGVRPVDTFIFSVKTKHDAHILLQNEKTDFSANVYLVIIGGWGGTKSSISRADVINYHQESGLLSQYEFRSFWISWNRTTILVGKSDEVGNDVFLTYSGQINDIKYVSVGTAQYTDANWRIPKGDKYYGCEGAGWLGYRDSCFLVVQEQKDWNEANNYCHKEGAELASIANADEQRFLFSQLPQDTYCFNTWNDTLCNNWAERGECDRNPVWMATHCHSACKHCMHNCRDKYHSSSKCLEWTRLGECDKNPAWMIPNCAQSCGVCEGAPKRGYWIGLQSSGMDQSYTWSDHSNVRFTHWNSHQPVWFNLQPRSCVAMFIQNGKWNDGHCTDPLQGFICKQAKMILPITTMSPFQIGCSMENGYGYGAYCYVYVNQQKSWSDAEDNCITLGGHLTYIGDIYTQAFVASELQNLLQDFWIGLTVSGGNWTWDGRKQTKLTMTHFDKTVKVDEVNDGCFAMATYKPVGLWKLYSDCSLKLPSICQIPREGFTTTVTTTTTTLSSTAPLPDCADTWQPYGQYCYKVSEEEQPWKLAQEICTHYGSSLVSIHDFEENTAVSDMADTLDVFWIGLQDTNIEGDFVWEDESPVDFLSWNAYEPNNANGNEDCAELIPNVKRWNDVGCNTAKRYICKIPREKEVNKDPHEIGTVEACDDSNPDDGWVKLGDFCYLLGTNIQVTWHDAKVACERLGSELASIHTAEELLFLTSLSSKSGGVGWIGLNDLDLDNRFSWTDATIVDFVAWAAGQPNDINGGEKCVTLYSDGTWHDYPCNAVKGFICKKTKDGVTIPPTVASTPAIQGGCPSGFNYTLGNRCYLFSFDGDITTWGDAVDRCNIFGGSLVSIHSGQEQDFIALNVYASSSTSMWVGMHDLTDDARFDWSDNSRVDYSNWAPNEPSSTRNTYSKEPCVEMWTNIDSLGQWNDVRCYASRGYICSILKDPSIPVLNQCPDGYIYMRKSCYKVLSPKQSWNDSVGSCTLEGGQLMANAEVPDRLIIRVLLSTSGHTELWIGGTANEGNVKWNDGSTSSFPLPYVNTGCLYSSATIMSSDPCTTSRAAVCKLTIGSTTAVTTVPTTEATTKTAQVFTCRNNSWLLYDTHCYAVVYEQATFINTKCSKYGMSLASIKSKNENFKIISWILQKRWQRMQTAYPYFWIGLSFQIGGLLPINWTDGSSIKYINFPEKAEPTRGCVMLMLYTGKWQIVSCTDKHFYLCKGHADIATALTQTTQITNNITDSVEHTEAQVVTTVLKTTTEKFQLPPFSRGEKLKASDDEGLSGGQIAGVVIGVIGCIVILGVLVYIARSWSIKKPTYPFEMPSLGFDNALFHKTQDTVSIN